MSKTHENNNQTELMKKWRNLSPKNKKQIKIVSQEELNSDKPALLKWTIYCLRSHMLGYSAWVWDWNFTGLGHKVTGF